jgi:Meiotically up-regulated gene 113
MATGFVYLIRGASFYKIGRSKDWEDRRRAYAGFPFPVVLVCLHKTHQMEELEWALHIKYAEKRLRGEWFQLTQSDVDFIVSLNTRVYYDDAARADSVADGTSQDDFFACLEVQGSFDPLFLGLGKSETPSEEGESDAELPLLW